MNKENLDKLLGFSDRQRKKDPVAAKKKKKAIKVKAGSSWGPLNLFRYSLAGFLVFVKLGLTSSAALSSVSWWLILLPAYIVELTVLAVLASIAVLGVLFALLALTWLALNIFIFQPLAKRRFEKKLKEGKETGLPTGNPGIDLLLAIQAAQKSSEDLPKPPNEIPPNFLPFNGLDDEDVTRN